jgi:hypothetical protein
MPKLTDANILDRLDDIEEPSVIIIYTNIIRTKYKRRCPYAYPKYVMPMSARYSELIADFLQFFNRVGIWLFIYHCMAIRT